MGTYAASGVVGFRDVASYLGSDYGYGMTVAARSIETMVDGASGAYKGIINPEEFSRADARTVLMAVGYGAHLPTRGAWRTLDYLFQYSEGNVTEFSLHDALIRGYQAKEQ